MTDYIHNTRGKFNEVREAEDDAPSQSHYSAGGRFEVFDWMKDVKDPSHAEELVEVRFKNNRKAYYRNVNGIQIAVGDLVAVEASPGHDIGTVTLVGSLVYNQLRKTGCNTPVEELRKLYRKARPADMDKFFEAVSIEEDTMIRTRQIVERMELAMKVSDVEYQGDRTKATFYYIADNRVDFRELIKVLAEEFKIRIEMKQIGSRQEAGRVGGIGSCGRELCCSSWMSGFVSVTTTSARCQEVTLNPQKLAGQCGKLKCCLNFEVKSYMDAQKDFPDVSKPIETDKGPLFHVKTDVYRRLMWFSTTKDSSGQLLVFSVDKVKEAVEKNRKGIKVQGLENESIQKEASSESAYTNAVDQDNISRFQENNKKKKHRGHKRRNDKKRDSAQE